MPQSPNPSKLRQPALKKPVVCSGSEQLLQVLTQHCAWVRAQVFDTIFGKPALDLGQCVTVLLGMLILVPYPCLARQGTIKGYVLSGTERVTWRFLRSDLDAKLLPPTVALNRRIQ